MMICKTKDDMFVIIKGITVAEVGYKHRKFSTINKLHTELSANTITWMPSMHAIKSCKTKMADLKCIDDLIDIFPEEFI